MELPRHRDGALAPISPQGRRYDGTVAEQWNLHGSVVERSNFHRTGTEPWKLPSQMTPQFRLSFR